MELRGESPGVVQLGPQLLPFASTGLAHDIELQVEWSATLEAGQGREVFHSGSLWSAYEVGDECLFDFTTEHLGRQPYKRMLTDAKFERVEVFLNREYLSAQDASIALEYPLDEVLITHYLSVGDGSSARGVELHACGMVGAAGESFLFVGHSGAGKSTTARLWTQNAPVEVLSDDRIILRQRGQQFLMYGTPWHGEAAFAAPRCAPLHRIFLLEHGAENRIERIPTSAAVGELLARSFLPFYQSRFVDPVLALLEDLARSVPCYRYQFLPDPSAVERIREFRE